MASTTTTLSLPLCSTDISDGYGEIEARDHDHQTLHGEHYVNGKVIDWYLSYLVEISPHRNLIHYFPTQPATRLLQWDLTKLSEERYQTVQRWTKKNDLFSESMVVIPVHQHGGDGDADHWYVVICTNLHWLHLIFRFALNSSTSFCF